MASIISALQLEQHRRQAGISLETISETTKISTRFLRAIESEEFEKLPGGVFNTSYIRQYASAIGFAESELLALYHSRLATLEPELVEEVPAARGFRSWVASWIRTPPAVERV
jgi:cytoskeletal protein RodZ